jgi:hypothetical protein
VPSDHLEPRSDVLVVAQGMLDVKPLGPQAGANPSQALRSLTRPPNSAQAITTSIRSISVAAAKPVVGRFPYPDGNGSTRPIAIGAAW